MTFLLQLYPGDQIARIVAMVIGQVAFIVLTALVFSRYPTRRRAATRSAIWLATLVCVLLAPLLAGGLELAHVTLVRLPMPVSAVVEAEVPDPTKMPPEFSDVDVAAVPQADVEQSSYLPVVDELPQAVDSRSPIAVSLAFSRTDKWRAAGSCLMLLWLAGVSVCSIRLLFGCGSGKIPRNDPSRRLASGDDNDFSGRHAGGGRGRYAGRTTRQRRDGFGTQQLQANGLERQNGQTRHQA